ncbi:MAG: MurR/RpiR family transcriptional regulator [Cetobacterium sp.]
MIDVHKLGIKFKLTESEMIILHYIINNIEESNLIGVRGVAKKCFSSGSVVMSLAKKLGYKGFVHMLYNLEQEVNISKNEEIHIENEKMFYSNYTESSLAIFYNYLEKYKKIYVHGLGFSRIISQYLRDKLIVLGFCAMNTEYIENFNSEDSLFISISKSGETLISIEFCKLAKNKNIKVVSFTGNLENSVKNLSDLHFYIKDSNLLDDRNVEKNDFFSNAIIAFEFILSKM